MKSKTLLAIGQIAKEKTCPRSWFTRIFTLLLSATILVACSSGDGPNITIDENNQVTLPLPDGLATAAITVDTSTLVVELRLTDVTDSNNIRIFRIAPDSVGSGTVTGQLIQPVPVGTYTVLVTYKFLDDTFSEVDLVQFDPQEVTIVEGQETELVIENPLGHYIDTDADGFSNLRELDAVPKSNPGHPATFPGNSLGTPIKVKVTITDSGDPDPNDPNTGQGRFFTLWEPVPGSDIYGVHMDQSPGVTSDLKEPNTPKMNHPNIPVSILDDSGFGHATLAYDVPWYIIVTSQDPSDSTSNGLESAEVFVRARPDVDDVPRNIAVESGDGQNTISWDPPANSVGTESYVVYWSTVPGVSGNSDGGVLVSDEITGGETSWVHTGLDNGTMYFYVVAVSNAVQNGDSSEVGATPYGLLSAPIVRDVEIPSNIQLDWADIPNAVDYVIYMAGEPGITPDRVRRDVLNGAMVHSANPAGAITFTHPVPLNEGIYYFRVAAIDKYGREGVLSDEIQITVHPSEQP